MNVVGTTYLNGCNYQVGYDLLGQNVAGNYSTVRFYGVLNVTNNYISWSSGTASVWSATSGLSTRYSRGSYTVVQQDVTLYHDNNGNYSATLTGSLNTTFVSGTASGGFSLPQIKRYPVLQSGQDFTDEGNPTLTFTSYGTFPIKVKLEAGGNTQLITRTLPSNATSYTFNLTDEERNTLRKLTPNSNTLTVTETVCAMSGNTELSASYKTYKMTIINANPEFNNFEFEDVNPMTLALTGNSKTNVNGYSNIKVTVPVENKAIAKKSATMSKYRLLIGTGTTDILYSDTNDVYGIINSSQSGTYNLYATDSRNNSTLVTKLAETIIDYESIAVDSVNATATRSNNGVGKQCTISFNGTFWNKSFGKTTNHLENITYRFKKTTDTEWIVGTGKIIPTIDNNKFSFSGILQSNNENPDEWNLDSAYNIEIIVSDVLSDATISLILNSAVPTLALSKNGVGIMGKYDDNEGGLFQIAGKKILTTYVLYSNDSGTAGTITLSNSLSDYDYIEIFYKNNDDLYSSVKVYGPDNKVVLLQSMYPNNGQGIYLKGTRLTINDKTLSMNGGTQVNITPSGNSAQSGTYLYITKILGYK